MKIVSWNLLHKVGATLDEVIHLIHRESPSILLMQETTDRIDHLMARIGGHYFRNPLPGRRHGLAVWSADPLPKAPFVLDLPSGLLIERVCQIVELGDFALANVHLSHGQLLNRRQLRLIAKHLPDRAAILGDCNLLGPPLLPGFRDVGPRQHTHVMQGMMPVRLDRCFVRGINCEGALTLPAASSDHRPILVHLSLP